MFEAIPAAVAAALMPRLEIPVIGIGAGPATDGQVLVFHDLLGIYDGHAPRFAKRYGELREQMVAGVAAYAAEVRERIVPGARARLLDRRRASCSTFEAGLDAPAPVEHVQTARRGRARIPSCGMPRLGDLFAPRDRAYFELFEEAGQNIIQAADLLERMLVNYPDSGSSPARSSSCEHEGDRITHDIIDRLNHTFVTPIDREDILALASALDDIVDYTEEVADYLGLYKIEAPMDQAISLARVLKARRQQIAEAIPRLRGFRDISQHTVEINRLENEGDRITREAVASLFDGGDRPDGRDPLEGPVRAPRGGDRRYRARRQHPRRHRD